MVRHEQQSMAIAVENFVEQFKLISDAFQHVNTMHGVGFNPIDPGSFTCQAGQAHLASARQLFKSSEFQANECRNWLNQTREAFPMSLLFWMEELRDIYNILTTEEQCADILVSKLSRIDPFYFTAGEERRLLNAVVGCVDQARLDDAGWLVAVSKFIENLHDKIGAPRKLDNETIGEMGLHTLVCDADFKNESVLGVLQSIYKVRTCSELHVFSICTIWPL